MSQRVRGPRGLASPRSRQQRRYEAETNSKRALFQIAGLPRNYTQTSGSGRPSDGNGQRNRCDSAGKGSRLPLPRVREIKIILCRYT